MARRSNKGNGILLFFISIMLVVILFKQLWQPVLTFIIVFTPLYLWQRKESRMRNEAYLQQLKEKYRVQDINMARMIDIINQLLQYQKQVLTPAEKKQKKQFITTLDRLLSQSPVKGYVYFVKEYGTQTIKIGKANNPYLRILKGFGVKIPTRLELLYLLRSDHPFMTERLFHKYFETKRVNGEWFNLDPEDIKWIQDGNYPIHIYNSMI